MQTSGYNMTNKTRIKMEINCKALFKTEAILKDWNTKRQRDEEKQKEKEWTL